MTARSGTVWRAFPWDPDAAAGARFSPTFLPEGQGKGRFDLPGIPAGVFYLAETPEHAVAEMIQHYRGQTLDDRDLLIAGHRLALVAANVPDEVADSIADLCDPHVLIRFGLRPDESASRDRKTTQRIASPIHAAGYPGLRWWSAFSGDWHTVVLFADQLVKPLQYDEPEPLTVDHARLREAARMIGVAAASPLAGRGG